jgi:hypothetical protein
VYGEQVMTPEYAKLHGSLVNSLMKLKQCLGHMVDETLGGLNMPTRRELRTLQDRLQESRREAKSMKAEIDLLKEQMIELRSLMTSQSKRTSAKAVAKSVPAAKKKASVKKRTVTKKAQSDS